MKKIYFTIDDKGYLTGWSSTRSSDNDIEIELDDNHEFFKTDFACWKYENGELVFDEEKQKVVQLKYWSGKNYTWEQVARQINVSERQLYRWRD